MENRAKSSPWPGGPVFTLPPTSQPSWSQLRGGTMGPLSPVINAQPYRLSSEAAELGDSGLTLKSRSSPKPHARAWGLPSRFRDSVTASTTATMWGWSKDVWKYRGCGGTEGYPAQTDWEAVCGPIPDHGFLEPGLIPDPRSPGLFLDSRFLILDPGSLSQIPRASTKALHTGHLLRPGHVPCRQGPAVRTRSLASLGEFSEVSLDGAHVHQPRHMDFPGPHH